MKTMPSAERQTYQAVVFTLVAWTFVAVVTWILRPLIPPEDPGRPSRLVSDFGRQSTNSSIDWRPFRDSTIILARQQQKPLLIFLGSEANYFSGSMTRRTLYASDVVAGINRGFIPVKVDLIAEPGWRSAFAQIARANSNVESGGLVVFARPDGTLLDILSPEPGFAAPGEPVMTSRLERIQQLNSSGQQTPLSKMQEQELSVLLSESGGEKPNRAAYADSLLQRIDRVNGGFASGGAAILPHLEWRFLNAYGREDLVRESVDAFLRTSQVDWLRGGFFTSARDRERRKVDFSRIGAINAQLAEFLAQLSLRHNEPSYGVLARHVAKGLLRDLIQPSGVFSYTQGKLTLGDRSSAYSLTVPSMAKLSQADQSLWRNSFSLDVAANPYLVPRLPSLQKFVENEPAFTNLFARTRAALPDESLIVGGRDLANQNARMIAALSRTALLLNDDDLLNLCFDAKVRCSAYLSGVDDVVRSTRPELRGDTSVADYLAMAELLYTTYEVFGDTAALRKGRAILNRCLFLFSLPNGLLRADPLGIRIEPFLRGFPEVIDQEGEAMTSQAIELLTRYGNTESDAKMRDKLLSARSRMIQAAGRPIAMAQAKIASYHLAAYRAECQTILVVVGPRAGQTSLALAANEPSVPVILLIGDQRPDLGLKEPGVYLVTGSSSDGPYREVEALAKLRQLPSR
ncbi:MAG: DUF255 domain-containing protein [Fimbriimonadaceae bacterium]|nr:DUF255 domain-containing protein [Fimbriimonadaceae bacterium]